MGLASVQNSRAGRHGNTPASLYCPPKVSQSNRINHLRYGGPKTAEMTWFRKFLRYSAPSYLRKAQGRLHLRSPDRCQRIAHGARTSRSEISKLIQCLTLAVLVSQARRRIRQLFAPLRLSHSPELIDMERVPPIRQKQPTIPREVRKSTEALRTSSGGSAISGLCWVPSACC